jgi:hypothetical protein
MQRATEDLIGVGAVVGSMSSLMRAVECTFVAQFIVPVLSGRDRPPGLDPAASPQ